MGTLIPVPTVSCLQYVHLTYIAMPYTYEYHS